MTWGEPVQLVVDTWLDRVDQTLRAEGTPASERIRVVELYAEQATDAVRGTPEAQLDPVLAARLLEGIHPTSPAQVEPDSRRSVLEALAPACLLGVFGVAGLTAAAETLWGAADPGAIAGPLFVLGQGATVAVGLISGTALGRRCALVGGGLAIALLLISMFG